MYMSARMTCGMKNLIGLLPDREKRRVHILGVHDVIADIMRGFNATMTDMFRRPGKLKAACDVLVDEVCHLALALADRLGQFPLVLAFGCAPPHAAVLGPQVGHDQVHARALDELLGLFRVGQVGVALVDLDVFLDAAEGAELGLDADVLGRAGRTGLARGGDALRTSRENTNCAIDSLCLWH